MQNGWKCGECGRVNAPWRAECPCYGEGQISIGKPDPTGPWYPTPPQDTTIGDPPPDTTITYWGNTTWGDAGGYVGVYGDIV